MRAPPPPPPPHACLVLTNFPILSSSSSSSSSPSSSPLEPRSDPLRARAYFCWFICARASRTHLSALSLPSLPPYGLSKLSDLMACATMEERASEQDWRWDERRDRPSSFLDSILRAQFPRPRYRHLTFYGWMVGCVMQGQGANFPSMHHFPLRVHTCYVIFDLRVILAIVLHISSSTGVVRLRNSNEVAPLPW